MLTPGNVDRRSVDEDRIARSGQTAESVVSQSPFRLRNQGFWCDRPGSTLRCRAGRGSVTMIRDHIIPSDHGVLGQLESLKVKALLYGCASTEAIRDISVDKIDDEGFIGLHNFESQAPVPIGNLARGVEWRDKLTNPR